MTQDNSQLEAIKQSILKVLKNDPKTMPLKVLMHKVFQDMKLTNSKENKMQEYIAKDKFMLALDELMSLYLVGKNKWDKYFIDYLDYEDNGVEGEGYLEVDAVTGNGYITIKNHPNEYKKSSYFVHKKNLNSAKTGDYVRFVELKVKDKKHFTKFALIDAKIKEILPSPVVT